jgi:hypothetical protein
MTEEEKLPIEQPQEEAKVEEAAEPAPPEKDSSEELRNINQRYAEEIEELKSNLSMVRDRLPRETAKEPNVFGDLTDEDIPTVGHMKKVLETREKQYRETIEEMQVATRYPDYQEVISSYLPKLLKEKPHLRGSIEYAPNKAMAAYELAAMYKASRQEGQSVKKSADEAARIVKNAQKPASMSQAGGLGTMSQADYYSKLSDAEFAALVQKNLED